MIAYKGFRPGLICRGYQFVMGLNTTEKANCRENGFHCAEDPLDCLSYYSSLEHSEYYIVNAGGDIDEDEHDSKIACTELTVIKRLTKEELFLHGLAYMVDHPRRVWSSHVAANRAMANCGYAVVRGKDPVAIAYVLPSQIGIILTLSYISFIIVFGCYFVSTYYLFQRNIEKH